MTKKALITGIESHMVRDFLQEAFGDWHRWEDQVVSMQ